MRRMLARASFVLAAAALGAACEAPETRTIVYYNFVGLPYVMPEDYATAMPGDLATTHYRQYAELDGFVVDLGCFVGEWRLLDCKDFYTDIDPNDDVPPEPHYRPVIVECECPCDVKIDDPCGAIASPGKVTEGVLRGTIDHSDTPLRAGGVEFPLSIDLEGATGLFITEESNDKTDPAPTDNLVYTAPLTADGKVLRGVLGTPRLRPMSGYVTVFNIKDRSTL